MSITTTPILSVEHVNFQYAQQPVLEDISFTIKPGEFVGIIGPNGSGKTTLLRLILGLLTPQSGNITFFDQTVVAGMHAKNLAYIPQRVSQADNRFPITVEEIVGLGRLNQHHLLQPFTAHDHQLVAESLEKVGLLAERKALITDLSGGQQQRVFIAKALASQPKVLLLDEPTVGIDLEAQENFYSLLAQLHSTEHLTIILVSHDIDVVVNEVTTVLCLNKKLVYHGNPQNFIKADYLEKLYGENRRYVIHGH